MPKKKKVVCITKEIGLESADVYYMPDSRKMSVQGNPKSGTRTALHYGYLAHKKTPTPLGPP